MLLLSRKRHEALGCWFTSTNQWVIARRTYPFIFADIRQSLERCYTLDDELGRLARINPNTKFLRARAGVLGFASKPSQKKSVSRAPRHRTIKEDDEDDPYGSADEDGEDGLDEDDVDTDVLPTLLAYRDGDLVHSWVRVDWEAEAVGGLEDLLAR